MRTSQSFLTGATVAVLALLGAANVCATSNAPPATVPPLPPPTSCTTPVGGVTFKVISEPTFVDCVVPSSSRCTQIEYEVISSTPQKYVFTLQGQGVNAVTSLPSGASITRAYRCVGIGNYGLGSCHEQAIKVKNAAAGVSTFKVTLAGLRVPTRTSVGFSPSSSGTPSSTQVCEILGIGLEGGPSTFQATRKTERFNFKGCIVEFTRDAATNAVTTAELLPPEDPLVTCTAPFLVGGGDVINGGLKKALIPKPVADLKFMDPDGKSYGKGTFADGFNFSSGDGSCTTYVIGGVVYTWGTDPCPEE